MNKLSERLKALENGQFKQRGLDAFYLDVERSRNGEPIPLDEHYDYEQTI